MRELAAALPRALAALPGRRRPRTIRLSLSARARRRLLASAVALVALVALYFLWLRDSSLVAVSSVEVSGLTIKDAPRVTSALTAAAEEMTTLHIRVDELEAAVRQFPVVAGLRVERDFPHGLRIEVVERRPAALVSIDGVPTPVAGDGTVLRGVQTPDGLPLVRMEKPIASGRVEDAATLRTLAVAGAAPAAFTGKIERISESGGRGIVLGLDEGPELVFGDSGQVAAKWTAALRVLADPAARGASYIDVRLPERPVAGGLPVETVEPVAPAGDPIAPPAEVAPADPAAQAEPTAAPEGAAPAEPAPAQTAPAPAPVEAAPTAPEGAATAPQP